MLYLVHKGQAEDSLRLLNISTKLKIFLCFVFLLSQSLVQ